ncbi:MAG: cation:proton antiporter [Propionibacteriaceae bacterium]|jgi:CPA1 family monovalent cation:H+ antiporter|nr:cation:proton antiporter [Propionibacteriaceae bacterium]
MHLSLQLNATLFVDLFLGALIIAASAALGRRFRVPSPLILVVVGVAISLAGYAPATLETDATQALLSQLILQGVLPPLLYASAVALPAMDLRRDFAAVALLSVVLVVVTAIVTGVVIAALLGVPLAIGIALGAILSPTDAVAVAVVERLGSPHRLVTILESEAMINDATALATMATALAAAHVGSVHIDTTPLAIGQYALWTVGVAVVAGLAIGRLGLWVSSKCSDPVLSILVALLISFAAYIPVNAASASGLVAVVVAGLVNGQGAPRHVAVRNRHAQAQTWETIEFLLEGVVFLLMGLQLRSLWEDVQANPTISTGLTVGVALVAGIVVLAARAAVVAPLVKLLQARARRLLRRRQKVVGAAVGRQARVAQLAAALADGTAPPALSAAAVTARQRRRDLKTRRFLADVDYLASKPLGWREGAVLTWAGMRGVVTLAAAQSLPATDQREALILIAFIVAAVSLFGQAGTLPWLLRRFHLTGRDPLAEARERDRLQRRLATGAVAFLRSPDLRRPDGRPYSPAAVEAVGDALTVDLNFDEIDDVPAEGDGGDADAAQVAAEALHREIWELKIAALQAMRRELLDARGERAYTSQALKEALEELDSEEISVGMRRENEE